MRIERVDPADADATRDLADVSDSGIPTERNARRMGLALAYAKGIMTMPGDGLAPST